MTKRVNLRSSPWFAVENNWDFLEYMPIIEEKNGVFNEKM